MFHCNGWTYPWAVTAAGATHVCLRKVDPARVWHELRQRDHAPVRRARPCSCRSYSHADAAPLDVR